MASARLLATTSGRRCICAPEARRLCLRRQANKTEIVLAEDVRKLGTAQDFRDERAGTLIFDRVDLSKMADGSDESRKNMAI